MKAPNFSKLSGRELLVLKYATEGKVDKEIAACIDVSINTVRTYWGRIRSKLGSYSRSALAVAYAASETQGFRIENLFDFDHDWELDLRTDRLTFVSLRPHPHRHLDGKCLPEILSNYPDPVRQQMLTMLDLVRRGQLCLFFLTADINTPGGISNVQAICRVMIGEDGTVLKLCGRRIDVFDASQDRPLVHAFSRI